MENKIKFCSYCPYCQIGHIYYCPECDDEEQDLYCEKLKKTVFEGLCWNEIASRHKRSDGVIDGIDKIPSDCPMNFSEETVKQTAESEKIENGMLFNPSNGKEKDDLMVMEIEDMVDMLLKSESGVYVVFDGTGKVRYEGDIQHCFAYYTMYSKWMGFPPVIYSIEEYKRMIAEINEAHRKHGLDEI